MELLREVEKEGQKDRGREGEEEDTREINI